MVTVRTDDLVSLFGALILGFVVFLAVNYLSLFGIVTLDSDLLLVSAGVVIGYVTAVVKRER